MTMTARTAQRRLLRLSTAGSVDDGKSTLIGRLLHDTGSLPEDQIEAVTSETGEIDLAAITDGLRAEAEQGITIDVAYRYFSTDSRDYILADTPGHERYTRNMFTGMSTADVSVILVDARLGVVRQTRRHAVITRLLGVRHVIAAVNKMDLVGLDQLRFEEMSKQLHDLARRIGIPELVVIPVVAKDGDNIVQRSQRTTWYEGPTLLEHLERVDSVEEVALSSQVRMPIQNILRLPEGGRRYAGRLASGSLRVGDTVTVLPEGASAEVVALDILGEQSQVAVAPRSLSIELSVDLDIARGDVIAGGTNLPQVSRQITAVVCWMGDRPLQEGSRVMMKHTSRWIVAQVVEIRHRLDTEELINVPTQGQLQLNDIGEVLFRLSRDIAVDPYQQNRETGSFILVDELSNDTVAAGCISEGTEYAGQKELATEKWITPVHSSTAQGTVVWIIGAQAQQDAVNIAADLEHKGTQSYIVDVRAQREGLSADLTPFAEDDTEHRRRIAYAALMLADAGRTVLVTDEEAREENVGKLEKLAEHARIRLEVYPRKEYND